MSVTRALTERIRRATRLALALLTALATALLISFPVQAQTGPPVTKGAGAVLSGAGAQVASTPKTVFQCKKKYKPGMTRTRCITRVKSQKPGTSCAHPLESGIASDGAQTGDTKDFSVGTILTGRRGPETEPEPTHFRLEVTIHNPQVVIVVLR